MGYTLKVICFVFLGSLCRTLDSSRTCELSNMKLVYEIKMICVDLSCCVWNDTLWGISLISVMYGTVCSSSPLSKSSISISPFLVMTVCNHAHHFLFGNKVVRFAIAHLSKHLPDIYRMTVQKTRSTVCVHVSCSSSP